MTRIFCAWVLARLLLLEAFPARWNWALEGQTLAVSFDITKLTGYICFVPTCKQAYALHMLRQCPWLECMMISRQSWWRDQRRKERQIHSGNTSGIKDSRCLINPCAQRPLVSVAPCGTPCVESDQCCNYQISDVIGFK